MAKEERSEDLNPRSKELDEKIRRLLDPSIPDEPPRTEKKAASKPAIKEVDGKRPIAVDSAPEPESTAPDLPAKKDRKVIVPIMHEDAEVTPANGDAPEIAEDETNDPLPQPETATAPEEKPVTKITVDHVEDSKEELAEKLDAAIADLSTEPEAQDETADADDAESSEEEATSEEEPPTAPTLAEKPKATAESKATPKKTSVETAKKPAEDTELPLPEPVVVTAKETDAAVKDIITKEGDQLLDVDDAIKAAKTAAQPVKKQPKVRVKWLLKFILWLVVLSVAACMAYPTSRYMALNAAGLRSSSSLRVVDDSTQQPLKNVQVQLGGTTVKTDADGKAHFTHLKLGKTVLKIERTAFAPIERTVTLGWGSNPLGEMPLVATGVRYKVQVTDFVSGKPVPTAEADIEGVTARADANGLLSLTVPQTDAAELKATIKAASYRDEEVVIKVQTKDTLKVSLVPGQRHTFMTKRSGKFDLYTVYADGKQEKLLLAGSGNERDDFVLLPRANASELAYASTRAGKKSSSGTLLTDLILVDTTSGRTTPVATAERIQLVGWSESRLLFVATTGADTSTDPKRSRLLSYSLDDGKTAEVATSNVFNDLLLARGAIYFAPSSVYAGGTAAQFFRASTDGSAQKTILDQEVWDVVRTSYEHTALVVGQQWYDYELGTTIVKKLDAAPTNKASRVYIDNPSGKRSAWVELRDGKGTLLIYDITAKKDTVLLAKPGLALPLTWLNDDTLVFHVSTSTESADYVMSVNGGEARKVRDVAPVSNLDNWYYY